MGAYDTPTQKCPYCGTECEADFVDVGVGMAQCGPYHCYNCHASEIGPEMEFEDLTDENGHYVMGGVKNKDDFTERELKTGWYEPSKKKMSPYANTVDGHLVDHIKAKEAYNKGLLDEKDINKGVNT